MPGNGISTRGISWTVAANVGPAAARLRSGRKTPPPAAIRPSGGVVLEYLGENYGLTEELLQLSRWIPQTRPELLSGPPHRSVLADVPLPSGYSSTTAGARLLFPHVVDGSLGAGGKFYQTIFTLSGNQFNDASGTTLPMVFPSSSRDDLYLPQVANGSSAQIRHATSLLLFNTGTSRATAFVCLCASDGTEMNLSIGGTTTSYFQVDIPGKGVRRLSSNGAGAIRTSWSRVAPLNQGIQAAGIFRVQNLTGWLMTEVGVQGIAQSRKFRLPADTLGAFDTGLAMARGTFSAPAMGLRLNKMSEKIPFAAGFIYGDR